ncbi:uncharacterized protein BX663DRAFT_528076 [Cokeromyces recurvatus]|uniref:uncharacterized protein n=1 Tax=Cokeromyces recurvatus TaxID=90255 RepID=UPI00221ECB22|nr:uncharacterized protein BX663DRAFT_528076 [Cokeromyces recurvatus]KAI7897509.1 hypothetical protein BX663DRAFT_528076 [Cokeromyces recurvatus]
MAQKSSSHDNTQKANGGLPVPIHPDDAKDKVFTAILKALLKMGNKPSSPKELANIIVKHKYATLGGATPFATVSSRISQHFKRAAEHNPPRAPLLAKHVDQNHSRKINYSLATTESVSSNTVSETHDNEDDIITAAGTEEDTNSIPTQDPTRTNSKTKRIPIIKITSSLKRKKTRKLKSVIDSQGEEEEEEEERGSDVDDEIEESDEKNTTEESKMTKKYKLNNHHPSPVTESLSIHPIQQDSQSGYYSPILTHDSDEESEGEHSDYHEEMLKGDVDLDLNLHPITGRRYSRRQSSIRFQNEPVTKKLLSNDHDIITHPHETPNTTIPKGLASQDNNSPSNTGLGIRKPSFSFSSGFSGEQELWTPFSFEHDFDTVFLHDPSTAHHIPFNITTPESISVSELDNYFASSTTSSTTRSQRKSFSSSMLGPNDKSLLQKVLLASAARGVADKIDEEDEKELENENKDLKNKTDDHASELNNQTTTDKPSTKTQVISSSDTSTSIAKQSTITNDDNKVKSETVINTSSSTMNTDIGEDFVKFEDDDKKETPPILTPINTNTNTTKKMADILPATTTTTLSAAEILKSMNIQNLNLSALHQMTSSIPSLQHLSPTFDLAKTMAAYMQSLAKSANANPSSPSSSTHAMDLKSILARFPALEAFIKKDPSTSSGTSTPPLLSPTTTEFIPNLISNSALTAGSTEPIVHTLTSMNPPMYITVIDNVPVCICVLAKTEHTPEYRLMRRVDTGFINGTTLLTAGGIETESERSMILSFEMERIRMPKKQSPLFGTWIPLRRAQELAVTCSIQRKLGHFLEDSIESYFPSPLPIQITTRKPARDSRLTALALAALRAESAKSNGFVVSPISRQSSSTLAAAQLHEILLANPHKALKSNGKAPLLSQIDDKESLSRQGSIQSSQRSNSTASISSQREENSDVDVVNSDSSAMSSNDEESDTETNDKKKMRSLNLEEILNRVTSKQQQLLHIHPRDLQKKRRQSSVTENKVDDEPTTKAIKTSHQQPQAIVRKKTGGKWSNSKPNTVKRSNNTSTTITIKRSSSSNGKKTKVKEDEEIANVVVEHKPSPAPLPPPLPPPPETVERSIDEDDEDEDIDIGGSDFDDDLR